MRHTLQILFKVLLWQNFSGENDGFQLYASRSKPTGTKVNPPGNIICRTFKIKCNQNLLIFSAMKYVDGVTDLPIVRFLSALGADMVVKLQISQASL
jgi:hypothetical protein